MSVLPMVLPMHFGQVCNTYKFERVFAYFVMMGFWEEVGNHIGFAVVIVVIRLMVKRFMVVFRLCEDNMMVRSVNFVVGFRQHVGNHIDFAVVMVVFMLMLMRSMVGYRLSMGHMLVRSVDFVMGFRNEVGKHGDGSEVVVLLLWIVREVYVHMCAFENFFTN